MTPARRRGPDQVRDRYRRPFRPALPTAGGLPLVVGSSLRSSG